MARTATGLSKSLTTYINCPDNVEYRVRAENEIGEAMLETLLALGYTCNRERPWIRQMKKSLLRGQVPDAATSDAIPSLDAIETRSQTATIVFSVLIQISCSPLIAMYDASHSAYHKAVRPMWSPDHHPSTDIAVTTNI